MHTGSQKFRTYRGYEITFNRDRPATGRWRGERFGVGMCAGTEEALFKMIDTRIAEAQARRPDGAGQSHHNLG